jgi:hypothetical protein
MGIASANGRKAKLLGQAFGRQVASFLGPSVHGLYRVETI